MSSAAPGPSAAGGAGAARAGYDAVRASHAGGGSVPGPAAAAQCPASGPALEHEALDRGGVADLAGATGSSPTGEQADAAPTRRSTRSVRRAPAGQTAQTHMKTALPSGGNGHARGDSLDEVAPPVELTRAMRIDASEEPGERRAAAHFMPPERTGEQFRKGTPAVDRALSEDVLDEDEVADASDDSGNHGNGASNAAAGSLNEVKRRRRLTPEETNLLLAEFARSSNPTQAVRNQLAQRLRMSPRAIQVWFQNRRAKVKKSAVSAAPSAPATTPASPTQIEHPSHFAPPSPDLPRGIPHPPYLSIPYQNNHYASVRPHAYPATSSPVLPPHYAYYDPRPSLHYSPHAHHPPTHLGPPQHHAPHHHARHPHQLHSPYSPPMQYSAYPSDYEHSRYERAPRRYSPYPAPQVFRPPPSPAWRNRMSRGPSEYNEGMDVDAGYFPPAPQPGYASAPSHRPRSVSKPPPFSQAEDVDMDDGEPELSGRRRSSLPADFLRAQLPPPGSAAFAGDLSAGQSKEAMEIEVVESGREPVREQEQLPCESAPPASRTERRPRAASNPMPTDRTISDAEITAVQVLEELTGGKRAMLPQQQAPPQQGFPSAPSQPAQMRGYPAHQHQQPQGRYHAQGYPPYPTPSTPGYGYRAPPASAGRPPSGTGYAGHPPRPPTPVQAKPRPVVNVPAPSQQPERRVRYVPIPPTTSQPAHGHQSGRSKMLEKRRLAHKRGASTGSIATEVKELAAAAAARKLAIEEERGRSRTPVDELLERSPVKPRGQRAMSAPHVVEDHRYGLACVEREMRRSQRALFAEINPTPESRARAAKEAARMAVERFPYAAPTMAPEVERIVQVGELIPGRDRGRNEMQALMHEIIGVPGVRRGRNHHVDIEPLGGIVQPGARKRSGRATP